MFSSNSLPSTISRGPTLPTAVVAIAFLSTASYLLATWQYSSISSLSVPCDDERPAGTTAVVALGSENVTLDFAMHHGATDADIAVATARQFPPCGAKHAEDTPCEGQRWSLQYPRERLEYRERHCPEKDKRMKCLVPAPKGYQVPFRWPQSRDVARYGNVPHTELVEEKGVQNWIKRDGDVFVFPGGGTTFSSGAEPYIDKINRFVPLAGGTVRTAIDTGCGVASWGAYLLSREIVTMSVAPKDTHKAQVWFALERGVPAMLGVLATKRLPYPSRAFDMAHCSRCLIPWHLYGGQYLMEIDRILRPGGYWILSGPPINWKNHVNGWQRTAEDLSAEHDAIEAVTRSLCWTKLQGGYDEEEGDIAVWQKPINHVNCPANGSEVGTVPFCSSEQDPDAAWYTKLEPCIVPLPNVAGAGEVAGGKLVNWPERLTAVPPRISTGSIKGINSDVFREDTGTWKRRVERYTKVSSSLAEKGRYRNILDMNAHLGGFAAALADDPVWVMNVVPTTAEVNTLGVIYERGLIGTYQDWCEAMSTYPRTYDLIHANAVFTLHKDRCEMEDILLEMDRILRPQGTVIFRDDVDVLVKIKRITDGMRWSSRVADHENGPHSREKILVSSKELWTVTDS